MALVDVVVVAYNSRDRLRACVGPLLGVDWIRPIVVDNASPDRSAEAVEDLPLTVVRPSVNRGFGAGCNAGWRAGDAPWVLFLNPDAVIEAPALAALVEAAAASPRVGAAGPRIVDGDGTLDYSIRIFPRLRSTFAQALFLHRLRPGAAWVDEVVRDRARYERAGPADWLSGACLLVRRDVLRQLGGFDERFFMYCEDADLCRRVRDLGLDVRYEPSATAVHTGGHAAPRTALLPILAESRVRYARLHRAPAVAFAERLGIALSALSHAVVARGGAAARRGHLRSAHRALTSL